MSKGDDLKQVAQLRKAIAPLIELMRAESSELIEAKLEEMQELLAKGLTVEVKAPDIKVEAPVVTVDLKGLEAMLKNGLSDMKKSEAPVAQPINLSDYRPHDQDENGNNNYYGFVSPGGDWYIMASQGDHQRYSFGKSGYEKAWDKRGKQSYGYLNEAILNNKEL